jgi:hypothetical protein
MDDFKIEPDINGEYPVVDEKKVNDYFLKKDMILFEKCNENITKALKG